MNLKILVDWKYDGGLKIENELIARKLKFTVYGIPNYTMKDRTIKYRIFLLYWKYLLQANKVLSESGKGDCIVCWNFTTAIAVGLANKIWRKKCIILGINIIAPVRGFVVEKIRYLIFHTVMKDPGFYVTVNSPAYIEEYGTRFKTSRDKFFVLNDAINVESIVKETIDLNYVFSGGENNRDWATMFKACELCQELRFVVVARKKYFDPAVVIPSNVTIHFDLNEEEFYDYLGKSTMVVLPLKIEQPAGLIVLLKSAILRKPLIITRTPSTSNYIEDNKNGYLVALGDYEDLAYKIKTLYGNSLLRKSFSEALFNKVRTDYSSEKFSENLVNILDKICRF